MHRNRSRAWSVYATDGTRIAEMTSTTSAIRATLPNAIIDEDLGIVRMVPAPDLGLKWRPPAMPAVVDHDAD